MSVIATDRRRLEVGSAPGSEARFLDGIARLREGEVRAARALAELDAAKAYLRHGCSSAVDWAVREGVRRKLARRLLRIGRVLAAAAPRVAEELRAGELDADAVAEIGKVVESAAADAAKGAVGGSAVGVSPDAGASAGTVGTGAAPAADLGDWLDRSKTLPDRDLRREVRTYVEGRAQQDCVVPMAFAVTESVRDDFRRARTVASRKARTALTDGQTLAVLTRSYLARHDPLRTERRARRVGPTSERPEDRYVPAEVRAAVLERSGDRCEFGGCGFGTFLQFAHVVWHRDDGDRESENLLRLCTVHHTLLDAGRIRFLGFGEDTGIEARNGDDGRRRPRAPEFLVVESGEVVAGAGGVRRPVTGSRADDRWRSGVRERAPPYGPAGGAAEDPAAESLFAEARWMRSTEARWMRSTEARWMRSTEARSFSRLGPVTETRSAGGRRRSGTCRARARTGRPPCR